MFSKASIFTIIPLLMLLGGCVAPSQVMVNPDTGATMDCSTVGWGWLGAPLALVAHEQCKERYKSLGFITSEDYQARSNSPRDYTSSRTASKLIITSDPVGVPVFAGKNSDKTDVFIGYTPIELRHPGGGKLWNAECYKVKWGKNKDSRIICKPREYGDRTVFFKSDEAQIQEKEQPQATQAKRESQATPNKADAEEKPWKTLLK
ncbi:MAG: hypothetical protein KKC30_05855 [Proteobacteria bacterium]|nr:hypothetical protein [Pseudomonadota bacterium]MBU4384358.1 hypothetical protein [Pseudomonadota bacterium]MCG2764176.1 hypothetical protein [Desulfarculaceae bacterium]